MSVTATEDHTGLQCSSVGQGLGLRCNRVAVKQKFNTDCDDENAEFTSCWRIIALARSVNCVAS